MSIGLDGFTEDNLDAYVEKFQQFTTNWNIPPNRTSLKMFLACALDTAMIQEGVTAIGDVLWERYYQKVLEAWLRSIGVC